MTAPLIIAMPGNETMTQMLGRTLGFDRGEVETLRVSRW